MNRFTVVLAVFVACSGSTPPPPETCSQSSKTLTRLGLLQEATDGTEQLDLSFEAIALASGPLPESYFAAVAPIHPQSDQAFGKNYEPFDSIRLADAGLLSLKLTTPLTGGSHRFGFSFPDRRGFTSCFHSGGSDAYNVTLFLGREQLDAGYVFGWSEVAHLGHP